MDLLLVRCADLASTGPAPVFDDAEGRPTVVHDPMSIGLSERGERHAGRLANWLRGHAPRELQIFASPAKAGRQMAGALFAGLGDRALPVAVSRLLGPEATAADLLGAVGWPDDHRAVLVVAHQPALGALASLLLTGQEAPLAFKKGALWWFSKRRRGDETQTVLRCVLTPELMKSGHRGGHADPFGVPAVVAAARPDVADLVRARFGVAA